MRDPQHGTQDFGDIVGNATARGEKTSPSSRGRGETSSPDHGVSHDGHKSR